MTSDRINARFKDPRVQAQLDAEAARLASMTPGQVAAEARPLTPDESAMWERAKRSRLGRPRKPASEKSVRVPITLAPHALKRADALSRQAGLNRSAFIAMLIARADENRPGKVVTSRSSTTSRVAPVSRGDTSTTRSKQRAK
jgi:hypothetical protein